MNDTYVEVMVDRKTSPMLGIAKGGLYALAIVCLLATVVVSGIFFVGAIVFCVIAYFVVPMFDIEYEYLYLDKEISIDRIYGKSRRKRLATYEVDRMEIMAPIKSYHLDEYRNNNNYRTLDFSSGIAQQPDPTYTMYYDGREKVVFEPNQQFIDAVKNVAPRKVFND